MSSNHSKRRRGGGFRGGGGAHRRGRGGGGHRSAQSGRGEAKPQQLIAAVVAEFPLSLTSQHLSDAALAGFAAALSTVDLNPAVRQDLHLDLQVGGGAETTLAERGLALGIGRITCHYLVRERLLAINEAQDSEARQRAEHIRVAAAAAAASGGDGGSGIASVDIVGEAALARVSVGTMAGHVVRALFGASGVEILRFALRLVYFRRTHLHDAIRQGHISRALELLQGASGRRDAQRKVFFFWQETHRSIQLSGAYLALHLAAEARAASSEEKVLLTDLVGQLIAAFPAGVRMPADAKGGLAPLDGGTPIVLALSGPPAEWSAGVVGVLLEVWPAALSQAMRSGLPLVDDARARDGYAAVAATFEPIFERFLRAAEPSPLPPPPSEELVNLTYSFEEGEEIEQLCGLVPPNLQQEVLSGLALFTSLSPLDRAAVTRVSVRVRLLDGIGSPIARDLQDYSARLGEDNLLALLESAGVPRESFLTEAELQAAGKRVTPDILFKAPVKFPNLPQPIRYIDSKNGWCVPGLSPPYRTQSLIVQLQKYDAQCGVGLILWHKGFSAAIVAKTTASVLHACEVGGVYSQQLLLPSSGPVDGGAGLGAVVVAGPLPNFGFQLFVGNCHNIRGEQLLSIFAPFGAQDSNVIMDRNTGQSRGFGFVTVQTLAEQGRAVRAMNGYRVPGVHGRGRGLTVRPNAAQ